MMARTGFLIVSSKSTNLVSLASARPSGRLRHDPPEFLNAILEMNERRVGGKLRRLRVADLAETNDHRLSE